MSKQLTEAQAKKVLLTWIVRLNLNHWEIKILFDRVPDGDNEAQIETSESYEKADIIFADSWKSWTETELNENLVHELLHLIHHGMELAAFSCSDFMGREARVLYAKRFTHELEKSTEHIASVLCEAWGLA
jgi:hypothetical protein